jgi:predicted phosphodiesterase
VRKLLWAGVVAGSALLLFLALLGILNLREGPPSGAEPGGKDALLKRVGVLGDAQKGLANLSRITAAVLREKVQLVLQTGDFVSNNDEGHYRLARLYYHRGGGNEVPMVVAPGNHDLKGGSDRFKAWCGELEKSFTIANVAFVVLDNAFGHPPPDPKHVEERIAAAGPHQAVVLAMHQPPFDVKGTPKPEYAGFLEWLEKSRIAYLLCGHEHGYLRKKVGESTVIINGVGGDYDKWQLDQKVYATILEIDGTTISDRSIVLEPVHEVWENIEHLAIGHLGEAYRRRPVWCWLGTVLLLKLTGLGWCLLLRRPRIPTAP